MAPLPVRAHSGLAARIAQPGLASRMDAHPAADRFDDPPADNAPGPDNSMPDGWSDLDWPSDDSMWQYMRGSDDPPKALSKKCKKKGITYEPYGLVAVHQKVTRDYLACSLTHTVDDKALTAELQSARQAYTLEQAELAKAVVIPTPQFADLTARTKYRGEGELLPHGDPPIPVTGCLPCPLGRSVPRTAGWVDVCPLDDMQFIELHELAKLTPPAERTREMIMTFRRVQAQRRINTPKPKQFGIHPSTPGDIMPVLQSWQCNPKGVPLPIHGELDGTLNTSDVDIWMWLKQLSPKSRPTNSTMWASLISLFSDPGRWSGLVEPRECLTPQAETLRGSVTLPFPSAGRDMATIPHSEIARWLTTYGRLTPHRVPRIEAYIARHLTKRAYNSAATEGQQKMKKAATRATKRARTKSSTPMITADQLDRKLAAARQPSPPTDPAASAAWHQDNGVVVPDHLTAEPGPSTQGDGPSSEAAPAALAGTSQPDPRPPPAPYTDVPMADVEDIVDYELDS
jgi:hypothetical protein